MLFAVGEWNRGRWKGISGRYSSMSILEGVCQASGYKAAGKREGDMDL
jgi:hypothetical protein